MSACSLSLTPESGPVRLEVSEAPAELDPVAAFDIATPRPGAFDGVQVDQLLLEAFTRARRRFRGPIVALSDRTTITNAAASELLQPRDRSSLWHLAQAGGCRGFRGCDTPVVLANGTTVYRSQYPVEVGGRLVGVVVHLQVAAAARGKTAGSTREGSIEREGTLRSITRQVDATLFTSWSDLTDSERTIVELVGDGLSNKQTGRRLFMSPHTVDYHLRRIYQKLGIRSRVELARLLGERKESLAGPLPEHRIA